MINNRRLMMMYSQKMFCRIIPHYREYFCNFLFYKFHKKKLNLKKPETHNEKLIWLMLYGGYECYSNLVDKELLKLHISSILGNKYVFPTILVTKNPEEFNKAIIPDKCVIKPTHTSGDILIIKNYDQSKRRYYNKVISHWFKLDYYYMWFESVYRGLEKKIIIEPYREDETGALRDYKVYCFDGKPKYIHVDIDRFANHTKNIYNLKWEKQDFCYKFNSSPKVIDKPKNLDEMLYVSEVLAKNFPFLRVDLYNLFENEIIVGELTFFPGGGYNKFNPTQYDLHYGEMVTLPKISQ